MPVKYTDTTKTRVPVCLCLDISGSVSRNMETLNTHVKNICESIIKHTSPSVVFEIIRFTFGGMLSSKRYDVEMKEFSEIEKGYVTETFKADENTPIGKAVKSAYQSLETYKKKIKESKMQYFQPIFIIISDGRENSTDQDREWLSTYQKIIRDEVSEGKMVVIPIGIGSVNEEIMDGFLPGGQKHISGTDINFDDLIQLIDATVVSKAAKIPQSRLAEVINGMARAGRKNLR